MLLQKWCLLGVIKKFQSTPIKQGLTLVPLRSSFQNSRRALQPFFIYLVSPGCLDAKQNDCKSQMVLIVTEMKIFFKNV